MKNIYAIVVIIMHHMPIYSADKIPQEPTKIAKSVHFERILWHSAQLCSHPVGIWARCQLSKKFAKKRGEQSKYAEINGHNISHSIIGNYGPESNYNIFRITQKPESSLREVSAFYFNPVVDTKRIYDATQGIKEMLQSYDQVKKLADHIDTIPTPILLIPGYCLSSLRSKHQTPVERLTWDITKYVVDATPTTDSYAGDCTNALKETANLVPIEKALYSFVFATPKKNDTDWKQEVRDEMRVFMVQSAACAVVNMSVRTIKKTEVGSKFADDLEDSVGPVGTKALKHIASHALAYGAAGFMAKQGACTIL